MMWKMEAKSEDGLELIEGNMENVILAAMTCLKPFLSFHSRLTPTKIVSKSCWVRLFDAFELYHDVLLWEQCESVIISQA